MLDDLLGAAMVMAAVTLLYMMVWPAVCHHSFETISTQYAVCRTCGYVMDYK